jgi:purine-binding chemotaxis protein CheW
MASESAGLSVPATQLLSFVLDREVFAVSIANVREILDRTDMTRVPRMPAYMRGALNLRGTLVPVVDLRVKFGLPAADFTLDTCVILIEVDVDGEATVLGALVDAVLDVFDVTAEDLTAVPRMGTKLDTEFIEAVVRHDEELIIVLNMNRVLSADEVIALRTAAADEKPARKSKKSAPDPKADVE